MVCFFRWTEEGTAGCVATRSFWCVFLLGLVLLLFLVFDGKRGNPSTITLCGGHAGRAAALRTISTGGGNRAAPARCRIVGGLLFAKGPEGVYEDGLGVGGAGEKLVALKEVQTRMRVVI
jgi:hypothetical protein